MNVFWGEWNPTAPQVLEPQGVPPFSPTAVCVGGVLVPSEPWQHFEGVPFFLYPPLFFFVPVKCLISVSFSGSHVLGGWG